MVGMWVYQMPGSSKVYLVSAIILLAFLFTVSVLPCLAEFVKYSRSMKYFGEGAHIVYGGRIILWVDKVVANGRSELWIDRDLTFYLNIRHAEKNVTATLTIYESESIIFNRSVALDINSPLLLFLFPGNESAKIGGYGYELRICPRPGETIWFSKIGFPRAYLGVLDVKGGELVITDDWYYSWFQGCRNFVQRNDAGTFFRYVRLEKGYMLYSYSASPESNMRIAEKFLSYGPPLITMLIDVFDVDFLRDIVEELRNATNIEINTIHESIAIRESNVYPVDHDWGGALIGFYMSLTPISQIMTAAAIILLILYFRGR